MRTAAWTLLTLASLLPFAASGAFASAELPIIAILDSGIRPTHAAFAPGQVVAWRDFVNGAPAPYDDQGHGTSVASMAAGLRGVASTRSHAPGYPLAIGKTLSASNSATWADMAAAVRWAAEDVRASVISISIYSYAPGLPAGSARSFLDAIEEARDEGVLVVVLAGNGAQNAGVPSATYLHVPGVSTAALVVGGAQSNALPVAPLGTMEPEVTALYTVNAACRASDTCTASTSGTSFSTPLVAGAAARLIAASWDAGTDASPETIELRLKGAARDTAAPPTLEGYGFLGAPEVAAALQEIADGAPPAVDPVNALYVETVQAGARETILDL